MLIRFAGIRRAAASGPLTTDVRPRNNEAPSAMTLPHNAHLVSFPLDHAVAQVLAIPHVEVDLAASKHFWEFEGDWDKIDAAYDSYFKAAVSGISSILGDPIHRSFWDSPDRSVWEPILPEYADAHELVVWLRDTKRVYCRYSHEDKEIPILIAIGVEGCAATGIAYEGQFD